MRGYLYKMTPPAQRVIRAYELRDAKKIIEESHEDHAEEGSRRYCEPILTRHDTKISILSSRLILLTQDSTFVTQAKVFCWTSGVVFSGHVGIG